ncbi:MAG: hypothetical protein ACI8X5_004087 [Planctomycetota bacterium]|jgi:hypothetical protein
MSLQFIKNRQPLALAEGQPPILLVVIDTEEEFDWRAPFDRKQTSVEAMRHIGRAQELFDEFGIRPTYVIDYPIASQETGRRLLQEYVAEGRAAVGAHLHPWVSPPFDEEVNAYNSYPGNLSEDLERSKLAFLTKTIEEHFGSRPTIYKAGRYGFGPNTGRVLENLGYQVDLSPCAGFDLTWDGGPDWSEFPHNPYRFGESGQLVGFPTTGAYVGWLSSLAPGLYRAAQKPPLRWGRAPGILSRLGALDRLLLSPEGYTLEHMKRLTRALLARGPQVLTLSFHSPSVVPGHTSYVRSESELKEFMASCRQYFEFFLGELGGATMGALELRDLLINPPASSLQPGSPA